MPPDVNRSGHVICDTGAPQNRQQYALQPFRPRAIRQFHTDKWVTAVRPRQLFRQSSSVTSIQKHRRGSLEFAGAFSTARSKK